MSSFAKISIRFAADLKDFSSEMQNAQRTLEKVGKKMQNVGAGLTVGLTLPIIALGVKSVQAFDEQAKALAQVEAGLKSTGNAVGFTSKQLQKMASDLQSTTLFGDEQILAESTSQLLTFTNIAGTQFEKTQQAALDLATRLDGDLKSASIQLGKALNDPVANLSALSRSGIQFSKEQKEVINSLVATNRLADAQTIILDELEKQYGGSAEAAAKAGSGPLKQFQMILGDITEQFGELILEYLNPFALKLKTIAEGFTNLSDTTKKTILIVAGLAAALGPVLVILGTLATTVIPAVGAALTFLTGPIGLVVAGLAAIAFVVYQNWDRIKAQFQDLQNYFVDLYNESVVFRIGIEQIVLTFKGLYNVVKLVLDFIVSGFTNAVDFVLGSFENLGAGIKAALTGDIAGVFKSMREQGKFTAQNFSALFKDLSGDVDNFSKAMVTDINSAFDNIQKRKKVELKAAVVVDEVKVPEVTPGAVPDLPNGEQGRLKVPVLEGLDKLKAALAPIQFSPLDIIAEKMPEQVEAISEAQLTALDNALTFNEAFTEIINSTAANFAVGFGKLIGSAAEGGLSLDGIGRLILGTIADMAVQVGQMAIGIGFAVEGIKKALQSLAGPVAIAAGIALVALGTFAKSALSNVGSGGGGSIPRFASGAIVYGPTVGLMGEYSGAVNNPEVIAPLDKLKGMLADVVGGGSNNLSGEFVVRGRDLVYVLGAAQQYNNRRK